MAVPIGPHPRTKIVCTIGPASSSPDVLRELIEAGLDVARINFSHGTHADHARRIATIRGLAEDMGRSVAILGDLQGPRIRLGDIEKRTLRDGEKITLAVEGHQQAGDVPVTYDDIANDVSVGVRILINDGLVELLVDGKDGHRVHTTVVHGGPISSNKGMNLPGIAVSAPALTEKDLDDVAFAVEHDLDYLALSFVRRPEDIGQLRALLPKGMLIVAKIEKDSALDGIEEILKASDAIMVARGDLGVELPFEEVPVAQKRMIALAT
ncbi:MAG: pyruvate kinase, partial [Gemmatimonadaceae bacterium]|nr:pyruvate kinase [Gemmatimonadaceae bacterium]